MPFLVVNGVEYLVTDAEESEPAYVGSQGRSFAGNLRSTIRGSVRSWRFGVLEMTAAEHATLRERFRTAPFLNCSGDALNGEPVLCEVRNGPSAYVYARGSHARVPTLLLTEVGS